MLSPYGVGCAYVCMVLGRTFLTVSMTHVLRYNKQGPLLKI